MFNPNNRRGFLLGSDPFTDRQLDILIAFAFVLFVVGIAALIAKKFF